MTTYYIGPGGSDGDDGLTYATRWATLLYAEGETGAGDTLILAPGVYKNAAQLNLQMSGTNGNPLVWQGDVTGKDTDGVGGQVMVTTIGSNYPTVGTLINATTIGWRTFKGIHFTGMAGNSEQRKSFATWALYGSWEFYDCTFDAHVSLICSSSDFGFKFARCIFRGQRYGLQTQWFKGSGAVTYPVVVENCYFEATEGYTYSSYLFNHAGISGLKVKNCTFDGGLYGAYINGQTAEVSNCHFKRVVYGIYGSVSYPVYETYNTFTDVQSAITYTYGGTSSEYDGTDLQILQNIGYGFRLPRTFGFHEEMFSYMQNAGASLDLDYFDLYGVPIPATASKRTRGAIQWDPCVIEKTITYDGSPAMRLKDYGVTQLIVPCSAVQMRVAVRAYVGPNYGGTVPRLNIKQPGQSERNTEFASDKEQWMQAIDVFTPAAVPGYFIVELQSRNTAPSGDYYVIFDDLEVKEV